MTFEIAFKRFLLSPSIIQFGENKPRPSGEAHVLGGGKQNISKGQFQNPGGNNENKPKPGRYDERGYRRLETISFGEVQDAYALYEKHLASTEDGALIKRNHFYAFPLLSSPAAMFGRVKVCLPMDGHIQDIQEMELTFPQVGGKPESVVLNSGDVDLGRQIQSYRFRVKIFGTENDFSDFFRHERLFAEAGFALDFSDDLVELLDTREMDDATLPWFHVIGSSWFAGFSSNLQEEARGCLWNLSVRETLIINYHIDEVKSLNDQLDYQYRLSDFYLTNPRSPEQTLRLIKTTFNKIFDDPASKPVHLSNRQEKVR